MKKRGNLWPTKSFLCFVYILGKNHLIIFAIDLMVGFIFNK